MDTSIFESLRTCLKSFDNLLALIGRSQYASENVPLTLWEDELGRLRIWAGNVGAHQTGQASLGFRLRDASHISQQVVKLLKTLGQTIEDVELVLVEAEDPSNAPTLDTLADDEPTSEIQELHGHILTIVNELFRMSTLIRKPARHDVLMKSNTADTVRFELFDTVHVECKYPYADKVIIQRLGHAITRRRGYLKYRERHHAKLGQCIHDKPEMSETAATDFPARNIDFEEMPSRSDLSETPYPLPPKESADEKPFECPYCFCVITIDGTRSWTEHIFDDLQPYICTFQHCSTPDRLYDSRREWFHHVTAHLRCGHTGDAKLVCPLCKSTLASPHLFEWHLARHLEELALFALPRNELNDDHMRPVQGQESRFRFEDPKEKKRYELAHEPC